MKEKEKMLLGKIYDAGDYELLIERNYAKKLCFQFNGIDPEEREKRSEIIRQLFGKTSEDFHIESNFWCDYGYNIEIGENFYTNHNCVFLDSAKITFGDNVFIGPNCGFYTSNHPKDPEERSKGLEFAHPIIVGSDVWFGGNVTVLSGVKIGSNSIIGAGSVVTKDIPENSVAIGNPCIVKSKNIF